MLNNNNYYYYMVLIANTPYYETFPFLSQVEVKLFARAAILLLLGFPSYFVWLPKSQTSGGADSTGHPVISLAPRFVLHLLL